MIYVVYCDIYIDASHEMVKANWLEDTCLSRGSGHIQIPRCIQNIKCFVLIHIQFTH